MRIQPILTLVLLALVWWPTTARAQYLTRPALAWRTVRTAHFVVHYPESLSDWALAMAAHLESVRSAVSAFVGAAPAAPVTVIVDNPSASSNGFAIPFIDHPTIFMWPTPPSPSSMVGDNRAWGEMLSVHEYTHVAHLTRPSRNPLRRFIARVLPVRVGPITVSAPRWVDEGYATYVEGRLTGSGRPHGAWRAAVLRTWALDGQLPTYSQLDGSDRYEGGAMAYLAGSAFLEWLTARTGGKTSLVHLWLRMSARTTRSFDDAFSGVFGGPPGELYGRFTSTLTGRALAVDSLLQRQGVVAGETVQRLDWQTGGPAVSRDGARMAIVLRARDEPTRVVVWRTAPQPESAAEKRARARERRLDPLDVPAIQWHPRPKQPIAELYPVNGVPYEHPRFLPDGRHVLVTRLESPGDGSLRPDLYVWDTDHGTVRRVTHGAGIRTADPSPDGRDAVADRCLHGTCDLVRVALATGRVTVLAAGSPTRSYDRPRYAPDGRSIAVGMHEHGHWHVVLVGRDGQALRDVGPDDDINRYEPAFLGDGRSLVLISERNGIPNVALVDLTTGSTRPLTRLATAALAPEPDPVSGTVYFLHLSPRGLDLNRVWPDSVHLGRGAPLPDVLTPAVPLPVATVVDTFARETLPASHAYGIGPRRRQLLPSVAVAPEGRRIGLAVSSMDPIGRLTWLVQGSYGDAGTWRGVSAGASLHRFRPVLSGELFTTRDDPSRQHAGQFAPRAIDASYSGAALAAQLTRRFVASSYRLRVGTSIGHLDGPTMGHGQRTLALAEVGDAHVEQLHRWHFVERVSLHGAAGRTLGQSWQRGIATLGLDVRRSGLGVAGSFTVGGVSNVLPYEQFVLGGTEPPLFDAALLAQRVSVPALPIGVAMGRMIEMYRVAITGRALQPYYLAASAGTNLSSWHRVVGVEATLPVGPIPFVALPSVQVQAGVAYSVDEPFRHKTRGYLSVVYRP